MVTQDSQMTKQRGGWIGGDGQTLIFADKVGGFGLMLTPDADVSKKEEKKYPRKWYFVTKIVRKNCSSDREKLLKFEHEGQEFAKILRSLENNLFKQ